jgi:hypothetical protein
MRGVRNVGRDIGGVLMNGFPIRASHGAPKEAVGQQAVVYPAAHASDKTSACSMTVWVALSSLSGG